MTTYSTFFLGKDLIARVGIDPTDRKPTMTLDHQYVADGSIITLFFDSVEQLSEILRSANDQLETALAMLKAEDDERDARYATEELPL